MGDLGYQSEAQSSLEVSYNQLSEYTNTLHKALSTNYSSYYDIGLKNKNAEYQQLNTHLLQIENEFYSAIRPKRTSTSGETPIHALKERGVEYIEVRCVDVNPLLPCGIDEETICFLDTFLLFCLLQDSPKTDSTESAYISTNISRTVNSGRDPELTLLQNGKEVLLREWGSSLIDQLAPVTQLLDSANQTDDYSNALAKMSSRIKDAKNTPAAAMLREMEENHETFFAMSMRKTTEHKSHFMTQKLSSLTKNKYKTIAELSIKKQRDIELRDTKPFDDFLADYYR
jgi:glutamate--cysteine ligase